MMGFNSNGHGGTTPSSFLKLSSLASPFPDNPSLSKQNPNLINLAESHFTQGPSYPFAFRPPDHNWTHFHHPPSIPNSFPTPNSGINSIHPTALPSTSSYVQSSPSFSGLHSLSRPYIPHYPSSATPTGNYPVAINELGFDIPSSSNFSSERSLRNGCTQRIPGQGYTTTLSGFRNGMSDVEHGRRLENDRSGSSTDKSLLNQGLPIAVYFWLPKRWIRPLGCQSNLRAMKFHRHSVERGAEAKEGNSGNPHALLDGDAELALAASRGTLSSSRY
ncbi:hypothetical protein BVC80_237g22 [Macleaya cordata]|uniref:Uncharacterized protein n=1 Tax=Macleaya cordata TaxID=56857 RepID=A0A200RB35_MACCD|nr:hypothetical protein BVC80_237g22 [Macleaya cordata]